MAIKLKRIAIGMLAVLLFAAPITAYAQTDSYIVQKGDTLWKIAVKYKVGLSEIKAANPQIPDFDKIYPYDIVYVPLADRATVGIEEEVLSLVNKERTSRGLHPLKLNWELARVARYKSEDMRDRGYFSHTSPAYGTPFDMIRSFNIKMTAAGENIAKGYRTAQEVMIGWMNSPGHRANILSGNFTEIGIGYCTGAGGPYWTQMFIRP
ncbi:MAG: CAP domain-containing protein [Oscillospiraceae bacterium]|nr:CAP domain-containing protein [Oscillospiraceae bacterium]